MMGLFLRLGWGVLPFHDKVVASLFIVVPNIAKIGNIIISRIGATKRKTDNDITISKNFIPQQQQRRSLMMIANKAIKHCNEIQDDRQENR